MPVSTGRSIPVSVVAAVATRASGERLSAGATSTTSRRTRERTASSGRIAPLRIRPRMPFHTLKTMAASKRWQLSPLEYKIDFLIVPVLFGIALWLAPVSAPQIVLGVLAWSFCEYAVHRFLLHRRFRRDHWAHHLAPTAYIGVSGIQIGIAYAVALAPARWLGLSSLYAGFMLGYFCYLGVHYAIHRPGYRNARVLRHLTRNHEMHHQRGRETNFGVTSPLWDFVFLTYSRSTSR